MKKILFLIPIFLGCSPKDKNLSKEGIIPPLNDTVYSVSGRNVNNLHTSLNSKDFNEFLEFFRLVSFDTLYLSTHLFTNVDGRKKATGIPVKYLSYLPEEVRLGATEWNVDSVYALYRFSYSPNVTALVAKVPSEFESSAISIFLYSNEKQKLLHSQRVAEFTGDAGEVLTENSWLLHINQDNNIDIVTKRREEFATDETLEEYDKYDTSFVYLGTINGFERSLKFSGQANNFKIIERKKIF